MYGTARATPYGYSLWEFGVYTTSGGSGGGGGGGGTGSGAPPASFWGDTSTIPAATHVLELKIVNQTNGQYPDSQVYWSFNGQEASIAQQPYIDMPANSAGRMYFYLGSPNSQYYDFIEFTVGPSSINVDTTRVDRFGLKLALFQSSVPSQFKELATDQAPYGIPSPGNDPAFQAGGAYANYFTSYAASAGDTSESTAQIRRGHPPGSAGDRHAVRDIPGIQASATLTPGRSPKRARASWVRTMRSACNACEAMIRSCTPRGLPVLRACAMSFAWQAAVVSV